MIGGRGGEGRVCRVEVVSWFCVWIFLVLVLVLLLALIAILSTDLFQWIFYASASYVGQT